MSTSIYERYCLPWVLEQACGAGAIYRQREEVIPLARGRVLEVGMGAGQNLPLYDPEHVEVVYGLEPSAGMRRRARRRLESAPVRIELLDLPGERVPLDDESVDTVVLTYTLCSITDFEGALAQMRRVLRPDGVLLFCEHGLAPDASVRRWQKRLNPLWRRLSGDCNLDRDIPALIEGAGFRIGALQTLYLPRIPGFVGFQYWGQASLA